MTDRSELEIRRATPGDRAGIIRLATRALDWLGDDEDARFFAWKHDENPFGPSPMWVACDGEHVVGFRAFLRWDFADGRDDVRRGARAVDTATDPDYQGRGVFTRLTLEALDALRDEQIEFVFNTPNPRSMPGYLKMGWQVVGRLPASVRPTRAGSLITLLRAHAPAARNSVIVNAGVSPNDAFADATALTGLLESNPRRPGIATVRSPAHLGWRYGLEALHYRVIMTTDSVTDGFVVFRLRRRGPALEAVVCELVVPYGDRDVARSLLRRLARSTQADYLLSLDRRWLAPGPLVRVPRVGPMLTALPLARPAPPRRHWHVTMGDIELL